ncbi:MAG: gliding motility-associated C-terminal domain-containing protein, partial [Bacteroidales bacterium]|nr:gliding motility-associated C-terminal domain-containing protein [Bacteroidales bacterium]
CSDDSTITVNFYKPPVADPGAGGNVCGLEFTLNATLSSGTGTWTKTTGTGTAGFDTDATNPNTIVTVSEYGSYTFTWTETNGPCSDDSTITVTFYESPDADPGAGGNVCGLEFTLNATLSSGTGTWINTSGPGTVRFNPDKYDPNAIVTVSDYGEYYFTWEVENRACYLESEISVLFKEIPIANAGGDQDLNLNLEARLNAELLNEETGKWKVITGSGIIDDIGSPNSLVTNLSIGENIFVWLVTNGICESEDEVIINVSELFIPSIITPNGDFKNDYFEINGIDDQHPAQLIIFDRWGNEVYSNEFYQNEWHGQNNKGGEITEGTYFYFIRLANGYTKKGFLLIKR